MSKRGTLSFLFIGAMIWAGLASSNPAEVSIRNQMMDKGTGGIRALVGATPVNGRDMATSRLFSLASHGPSAASSPVLIPDQPALGFDEIGLYLVGYAYRGQPEKYFPIGAELDFEQNTGVACRPDQPQNGRRTFLLHCPWRNGTGTAFQLFTVGLPPVKSITLQGATALRKDAVGKSDGVTFRLYVDQVKLLDVNQVNDVWRPFSYDLTASGGRTVDIRFETDPGPADNPAFDYSLWGDRELVLEGYTLPESTRPDPPPLDLKKVVVDNSSVIPSNGFNHSTSISVEGDTAVLRYSGEDGTLAYQWRRPATAEDLPLGNLTLQAQMMGDSATSVPLAAGARIDWTDVAVWQESRWEMSPAGLTLVTSYRVGSEPANLRARPSLVHKSLVIDFSCDRAVIGAFTAGAWGPVFRKQTVTVPYYSGRLYFLNHESLFVNTFLDWTESGATWFDGVRAGYDTRTDGSRVPLKDRVIFAVAWHPAEVMPNIPNPPSPHRDELGGRLILDIWGGRFSDIASRLRELSSYGLDRCAAIIHGWQRSGYDNALPMHIPARDSLGGEDGMRELSAAGKAAGYLFAVHENYVDYYPNYDYFNDNDISLDSAGQRVLAWYNPVTGIQSFGERPDAMVRLASTQSPEIHRRYGTSASFLDVNSAVEPWKNIDHRANTNQSAQFSQYADSARELWQYLRDTHGGPVFGEGLSHWYWSGLVDGVEAQFGVGWPWGQGLSAPLMVDFDLLKIHPLQVNHGMGYYDRWWDQSTGASPPPMIIMDQYRMQEIAYGHAPFLDNLLFWSSVPVAWLEHHLVTPVAQQYGTSSPARISYQIDGKWQDSTAAAKRQIWNRLQVEYENGLTVTANGTETPMDAGSLQLPPFGWLARGQNLTAYTALQSGAVVDFADTSTRVFANTRDALDWDFNPRTALPTISDFSQTGSRRFRVTYQWQVFGRISGDYQCFIHFVVESANGSEQISFQQDHSLAQATSFWKVGDTVEDGSYSLTLPDGVADGDYQWMIGLYLTSGPRLPMIGGDGQSRVRLGVLHVRDGGKTITFDPDTHAQQTVELYRRNVNAAAQVIDFGSLRTDGCVLIRNAGAEWVLQALPRDRAFTVQLDDHRFGMPTTVTCIGGSQPSVVPQPVGQDWWRLPMTGAQEYRWENNFWNSVLEKRNPRRPRRTR